MNKYDVIIIDGNNFFFKVFSTQGKLSIIKNCKEIFTGATYGLIQSILASKRDYLKHEGKIFIVWDKGHKKRTEIYPEYKNNRDKSQWDEYENFKNQMKMSKYVLSFLGVRQASKEGEEADDIAGTLSRQYAEYGEKVLLMSADKDFQQLIRNNVDLLAHKGAKNIKLWTEQKWREEYGYHPSTFLLFLALNGDTGDNIPGIKGIGEVAANKLITQHLNLLYLILAKKDISLYIPEKQDSAIKKLISKEGQDNFRLSYELASIDRQLKDIKIIKNKNLNKLKNIFEELQFDSLKPGTKYWNLIESI